MAGPGLDHPLTTEPRDELDHDETHEMADVDVRITMSGDGKRVRLKVTDQEGDDTRYELEGASINQTPIRVDKPLVMNGVDAVIEWGAGGIGLYSNVDVRVSRDD